MIDYMKKTRIVTLSLEEGEEYSNMERSGQAPSHHDHKDL
jgi:hypothetical protein